MLRGGWRPIAAFAGIAALLFGAGLVNQQRQGTGTYQGAYQDAHSTNDVRPDTISIGGIEQTTDAIEHPSREDERAEQDLRAQQQMALWAERMFWATIIAIVIAIAGVVYVAMTLHTAREANKGFADAARRQLRAYLSIENVQISVSRREDRAYFRVDVRIKNCGQTPARKVERVMEVWPLDGHTFAQIEGGRIGLSMRNRPLDIGPGLAFEHEYRFSISMTEVGVKQPGVQVRGWINYSDFSDARWRVPYLFETGAFWLETNRNDLPILILEQTEEQRI